MNKKITAFAPASIANVAVGFDILGFSFSALGDEVSLSLISENEIRIDKISDENLPRDPMKNTATRSLMALKKALNLKEGFSVEIKKGLPLCSGLGSSAASSVASVVAANALLDLHLSVEQLIDFALSGEEVASGSRHADNVAPCLLGGLTLIRSLEPSIDVIRLPSPADVYALIIHPDLRIATVEARKILKPQLPMELFIKQSANLSAFIAACFLNDQTLIQRSLIDLVIEPQRAHLIPGFYRIQKAALEAGALGFSLSGSGPALFALCPNASVAKNVGEAIVQIFAHEQKITSRYWICSMNNPGAKIL